MLLNLTELSSEPLHRQISRQVVDKIVSEELMAGAKLLPINTLARSQHVSLTTVKRAYDYLERNGFIKSQPSKGFFVATLTAQQKQAIANQKKSDINSILSVVENFSKQLLSVFDSEKLRHIMEENIKKFFEVENVYFSIYDDRTNKYSILPSETFKIPFKINNNDAILQTLKTLQHPFPLDVIEETDYKNSLSAELSRRKAELIVPLNDADRLLGFVGLTGKGGNSAYTSDEINLLMVLANQFVTALTTARFYIDAVEKQRMESELHMARKIQKDLLPKVLPDNACFSVCAYSESSQLVGGDLYDYIPLDDQRFGFMIADACGKGLPAAMLISQIQAMLRSELHNGNSIPVILENMNKQLIHSISKNKFATVFVAILDHEKNELEYATAGHNYPFIIGEDGCCECLQSGGPALGMHNSSSYCSAKVKLHCEDFVFLYTDGITETMNDRREEYGEERLKQVIDSCRRLIPRMILNTVVKDIENFECKNINRDDRTMMALKIK